MKKVIIFLRTLISFVLLLCILNSCDISTNTGSDGGIDKPLEKNYTVSFETNGGSSISSKSTNILEKAPTCTRANHFFDGWYRDASLTTAAVFPLTLEADTTLYAKWLKIKDSSNCEGTSIKCWSGNDSMASWSATPSGFDWDQLEKRGFTALVFEVTYEVKYRKDYDVPFDIGYAGSPKYEIGIVNSKDSGKVLENLGTTTSYKEKSISYTIKIADAKNDQFYLKVFTDNIQNLIFFDNITITYECK